MLNADELRGHALGVRIDEPIVKPKPGQLEEITRLNLSLQGARAEAKRHSQRADYWEGEAANWRRSAIALFAVVVTICVVKVVMG